MKGKIIIGLLIVAIVAVGAFVMLGGGSDEPDARYNYELTSNDSFVTTSGYTSHAKEGMTYIFASVTLSNDKVEKGIYINPHDWSLETTGLTYNCSVDTYLYPHSQISITVNEGNKHSFVIVFEVPNTVEITNAKLICDIWPEKVVYDSTL